MEVETVPVGHGSQGLTPRCPCVVPTRVTGDARGLSGHVAPGPTETGRDGMVIIGIDGGLQGAVGILNADGALVGVHDVPTLTLRTRRGTRQEYDIPGLVALLAPYSGSQTHVIIEEAQAAQVGVPVRRYPALRVEG